MLFHIFDLLYVDPDQVREFLLSMAKSGLVGGVYLWINRENGKMYVGSSVSMHKRMNRYFSNKSHGIIKQALLKYGLNGFVLVLFLFPNATTSLLLALEQYMLDNCVCEYNILPTAGSSTGYKLSDEAKAKISAAKKGNSLSEEHKANLSAAGKGKSRSEETKAKMSDAMKGRQGEKASRFNKGKPVYLYVVHARPPAA